MKKSLYFIIVCLGLVLLVGCSSPDESANKLFVEASKFVKEAQEAEKVSYADAFKLYEKASGKLERITLKYPSSQLAVKITQNDFNIGPYTITEFKETILSKVKIKAAAEGSPLATSLLVAKSLKKANWKAWARALALTNIAGTYVEAGQKEKASEILSQALVVDRTIKNDHQKISLGLISGTYAKAGQYDQALEVARTTENDSNKADRLSDLASTYVKAGQKEKASEILSQALEIARTIEKAYWKARRLDKIARTYAEAGQKEKASEILSQALEVARTIEKDYRKARALASIAGTYVEAGQKEKASEILSQALEVARTIEKDYPKARALTKIASTYVETGQKVDDRAKKILHEILREID